MSMLLFLSILIHFGNGFRITGDPYDKCLLLNWQVEYHPENRTLFTEIDVPFYENLKCFDFFHLESFNVWLNTDDGKNVQAVKIFKDLRDTFTFTFHDVEPCRSYEIVMIPNPNDEYKYTYDYEYRKFISDCTEYYSPKEIVPQDVICSLPEQLNAEYRPEDGSVAVWFNVSEQQQQQDCFEMYSLSWADENQYIKQIKVGYFRNDVERHIFYNMEKYMTERYIWNNPCKELDIVFRPCHNLSDCLKERIYWRPHIDVNPPTVHAKINSCTTIEPPVTKELDEKIKCSEHKLNIDTQYHPSNHTALVRFRVSDPKFLDCFEKFYIYLNDENRNMRSVEISETFDWNTYTFYNVEPCRPYDVTILPCYNSTSCAEENHEALIDTIRETCIKPHVCNSTIPKIDVYMKNMTVHGSFEFLDPECFTSYDVFLIHRKRVIGIQKVFPSSEEGSFSFRPIGKKNSFRIIIRPCYNSWLCAEEPFFQERIKKRL